jgi:hypothetical protein
MVNIYWFLHIHSSNTWCNHILLAPTYFIVFISLSFFVIFLSYIKGFILNSELKYIFAFGLDFLCLHFVIFPLWSVRFFFLDDITGFEITYLLEVCSELQTGHLGVIWFQNVIASDSSCIFKILSFITFYFLLNLNKQFICTPLDFVNLVAGKLIFCRVNIREQSTNEFQFDGKKISYFIIKYKVTR